jgi:glycosyltransferase involved in cell wall biosynthesis
MKEIIIVAYDLNPNIGSEASSAYNLLKVISKHYHARVFVDAIHERDIRSIRMDNVEFSFIKWNIGIRNFLGKIGAHNIANFIFISKVKKELPRLNLQEYSLIHCLTPHGIHSFNDLYKFGVPIIIGPVGGGLPTPEGFEDVLNNDKMVNYLRKSLYAIIPKFRRWKEYFLNARKIIVGTELVKLILPKEVGSKCVVMFDAFVDTDIYVPKFHKSHGQCIKILFAGRLVGNKGITLLIEAANLCAKLKQINFSISIAGDGPLKRKLERTIENYGLGTKIDLLGLISRGELLKKYQNYDIFCLPTLREPGGNSILEAMSCGLPIITSNYGGPKYSVTEECGIKIELKNAEQYIKDLSEALIKLISDSKLRIEMGKKARERVVQEFSLQALESKIVKVYKEVLYEVE